MRGTVLLSLLSTLFLGLPAESAVLIPVTPPSGSTSTVVYGINDSNVITGYYQTSDGVQHGFVGPLNGAYTTFDYGETYTNPRAINNNGYITGTADNGGLDIQFERNPGGEIATITMEGFPAGSGLIVQGINSKGVFVGNYLKVGALAAYYGKNAQYQSDFVLPDGSTDADPRGINDSGAVAGFIVRDETRTSDGFVVEKGVETLIDYPDPDVAFTFFQSINKHGTVAGYWTEKNLKRPHAFTYDSGAGTFKQIKVPHSKDVEAYGINSAGLVTIDADTGAFIYCPYSLASGRCPSAGIEIVDAAPIQSAPVSVLRARHHAGGHPPSVYSALSWGRP